MVMTIAMVMMKIGDDENDDVDNGEGNHGGGVNYDSDGDATFNAALSWLVSLAPSHVRLGRYSYGNDFLIK
jgi:hypothetical protein